uniref:Paired amphipathic helix protein Sin3-like 3 n=1 Tax=Nicotiana tabacum TaxID=4097 RepID=A0A1S3XKQ8_TOBAC|nr:PREDICTED: paired amphipathic helix protein Sin3-like 3 [Nicotiana tabacum]
MQLYSAFLQEVVSTAQTRELYGNNLPVMMKENDMRRLRVDVHGNTQLKRPFGSSRGESYDQSQVPGSGLGGGEGGNNTGGGGAGANASTQKLTTNDALSYLKEVKEMFQDQRDKYDLFLERIDTAGVIARVKDLFKGHPRLILEFNTFLPKGYEITLNEKDEPPPKRTVEFEEAISFVNKIRVAVLFDDHPDLLDEFTKFLPDTSATALTAQTDKKKSSVKVEEFGGPHEDKDVMKIMYCQEFSFCEKVKERLQSPADYQAFLKCLHLYSTEIISRKELQSLLWFAWVPLALSVGSIGWSFDAAKLDRAIYTKQVLSFDRQKRETGVADLLGKCPDLMEGFNEFLERCEKIDEFTIILPDSYATASAAQTMMKLDQGTLDQDYKESDNENNGDLSMQRHTDKKKSAVKIEEFGGPNENKDALKNMYSQEFTFCEKVKERLQSPVDYQAFLHCLHIYSAEIISRKELQHLVAGRLGKYPDLIESFNEFLEHYERVGVMSKSKSYISKLVKGEKDKEQKHETEAPPTYPKKEEKEAPPKRSELEESIIFVKKVKVYLMIIFSTKFVAKAIQ